MSVEVWVMMAAGIAALVAGLALVWPRFRMARGAGRVLVLGPVFEATALAIFSAEHFKSAHAMMDGVPRWLPWPLFWVYFFGVALALAAISFVLWRGVRWSAPLLALFFLLVVVTIHVPNLRTHIHERLFLILVVREMCFAGGAMVLAGSVWLDRGLMGLGRFIVGAAMVFYGVQHFYHPQNVPGVPLEKITPAWVPAPEVLAYFVGVVLLIGGIELLIQRRARIAAAVAGSVLVLLMAFFYVPIFLTEMHSSLAVEGMNYIGDTLLFGATVLLAGWDAEQALS